MAADITGTEKVQEYIRKSGRDSFAIMRPGQNLAQPAVFEALGDNAQDAAEKFGQWADISSEGNTQRYELNLYMKGQDYDTTDKAAVAKAADKKYKSKLCTTFQLYADGATRTGGPTQAPIIAAPAHREVVRETPPNLSGYMTKAEAEAMVNGAVEKVQTNHMIQQLSADIVRLSRRLEEQDMEDEEEEDYDEEEELEMIDKVGDTLDRLIKTGKDAYLEIKGSKDGKSIKGTELNKNIKAAAPSEQDFLTGGDGEEVEEEEIEVGAEEEEKNYTEADYGKLPAYMENPVNEDQQKKVQWAISFLYKQDQHLGDDLMLIAKMAKYKPKKFQGLILSLRED